MTDWATIDDMRSTHPRTSGSSVGAPQVVFEQGLADTVAWYRNNENWWRRIKSGEYTAYYERQYGKK